MEKLALAVSPKYYDSDQELGSSQSLPAAFDHAIQNEAPSDRQDLSSQKWDADFFRPHVKIGQGHSARVFLVESTREPGKCYAAKVLTKGLIIENDEVTNAEREKLVLQKATSRKFPFIAHIFGGCQTTSHLVLYMKFYQGGHLMSSIQRGEFGIKRSM